jgi:hypothetical protein
MKTLVTVVVLSCVPLGHASTFQLSSEQESRVVAAIRCGLKEIKCESPAIEPGFSAGMASMNLTIAGPLGRVYLAARAAKAKMKPFGLEQVTEQMLAPVVEVTARYEFEDMKKNPAVDHIVVLPNGSKTLAIQPSEIEPWDYEARNLLGAVVPRRGKRAQFKISDLPATGTLVVVATSDYMNYDQKIDVKKRLAMGF